MNNTYNCFNVVNDGINFLSQAIFWTLAKVFNAKCERQYLIWPNYVQKSLTILVPPMRAKEPTENEEEASEIGTKSGDRM